jgi:hypothetical protein
MVLAVSVGLAMCVLAVVVSQTPRSSGAAVWAIAGLAVSVLSDASSSTDVFLGDKPRGDWCPGANGFVLRGCVLRTRLIAILSSTMPLQMMMII